jgi:hypothetical protein
MGATPRNIEIEPQMVLSDIFYNQNADPIRSEFIGLYNPDNIPVDISGYSLAKAVKFTFPQGTLVNPGEKVYVAKNMSLLQFGNSQTQIFQWTDGSLANEGETIRLISGEGYVMDQVAYKPEAPWPNVAGADEKVLSVISPELDNHFGDNWRTVSYSDLLGVRPSLSQGFVVYPNPTRGNVTIKTGSDANERLEIFTVTGQRVYSADVLGQVELDLSIYGSNILFAKLGKKVEKIVVLGR